MSRTKIWLGVVVVAFVLGVVLAQVLPDADFNNLTAQGSVPLTLGDNTDKDMCIEFDDNTNVDSFCYDTAAELLIAETAGLGIRDDLPMMNFFDTDYSTTTAAGGFRVQYGSPEATDSEYVISYLREGNLVVPFYFTSTTAGESAQFVIEEDGFDFGIGYTGNLGAKYAFLTGAEGYYFDDDIYVDETSGGMFVKDSGGNCYKCILGATQTYTPTNVTTDRAFDANSTTLDEIADVLGSLIADLDTLNHVGTSTDQVLVCSSATCPSVTP